MLRSSSSKPSLLAILPRAVFITILLTGLTLAVSLFLGIIGMVILGFVRGHLPDMTAVYRHFAFPIAAVVAGIVFVGALINEVRVYLRARAAFRSLRESELTADPQQTGPAPRIAIPLPRSDDADYSARALPQYEEAVAQAGGEPVRIPLDQTPAQVMKVIERCDGVLLPGSGADVDPAKYDAQRHPETAAPDPKRDTVDELLLQDAYNMRKPIFAICYGLQMLNVYRSGTLVQHIPDALPPEKKTLVNHDAGRKVAYAHHVEIDPRSQLAEIVTSSPGTKPVVIEVNSSHHQSADVAGDSLRIVARCKEDGVIEALEGTAPDHFVLAVQWHPERSTNDAPSRALFRRFVDVARAKHETLKGEFEAV